MKGFIINLEKAVQENNDYRRVIYTAKNSQLVLMRLRPGEEIGEEVHHLDQFLRFEKGTGKAVIEGIETAISDGWCAVVPAGTRHNFINSSQSEDLLLYTVYSPPDHQDGIVRATKAQADDPANAEEFNGKTTE